MNKYKIAYNVGGQLVEEVIEAKEIQVFHGADEQNPVLHVYFRDSDNNVHNAARNPLYVKQLGDDEIRLRSFHSSVSEEQLNDLLDLASNVVIFNAMNIDQFDEQEVKEKSVINQKFFTKCVALVPIMITDLLNAWSIFKWKDLAVFFGKSDPEPCACKEPGDCCSNCDADDERRPSDYLQFPGEQDKLAGTISIDFTEFEGSHDMTWDMMRRLLDGITEYLSGLDCKFNEPILKEPNDCCS